jgi:hypothetical protein
VPTRHLCRFTVENTSDPGFAMRVKNSSLKRHKCRAPIVFLNQPWRGRRHYNIALFLLIQKTEEEEEEEEEDLGA